MSKPKIFAIIFLLVFFASFAWPEEDFKVEVNVNKKVVYLAEPLVYHLEIVMPKQAKIKIIPSRDQFIYIKEQAKKEVILGDIKKIIADYSLQLFKPGQITLTPFKIICYFKNQNTKQLNLPEVKLEVKNKFSPEELEQADIKGLHYLPKPKFTKLLIFILLLFIAGFGLKKYFWVKRRCKGKNVVNKKNLEILLEDIYREYSQQTDLKIVFGKIYDFLRSGLKEKYKIESFSFSPEELTTQINQKQIFSEDIRENLENIIGLCKRVKFSGIILPEDKQNLADIIKFLESLFLKDNPQKSDDNF